MQPIKFGEALVCAETGKQFIAAQDGCTFNYARGVEGRVYSDEGVHAIECRQLLDRSRPFFGYISSDGKTLTGWKDNILGHVVASWTIKLTRCSYVHGKSYSYFRIRDIHGKLWNGRGSPGVSIKIRAMKKEG